MSGHEWVRAVLLCNLKPAKMRGIESQAMVLAASDKAHTIVELLTPPEQCASDRPHGANPLMATHCHSLPHMAKLATQLQGFRLVTARAARTHDEPRRPRAWAESPP